MIEALVADVMSGQDARMIAFRVHSALADVIVRTTIRLRDRLGELPVGISGGVFQNRLLQALVQAQMAAAGVALLQHRIVPPNDGGLALGQALVAAHADLTLSPASSA